MLSVCSQACCCRLTMATSHLVRATTMGHPECRAWANASFVCGITPSSAATTSTTCSHRCQGAGSWDALVSSRPMAAHRRHRWQPPAPWAGSWHNDVVKSQLQGELQDRWLCRAAVLDG